MSSGVFRVSLPLQLQELLSQPPVGPEGGFTALMAELRQRMQPGSIEVDAALQDRIEHYAYDFGRGYWQLMLRQLLELVESAAKV